MDVHSVIIAALKRFIELLITTSEALHITHISYWVHVTFARSTTETATARPPVHEILVRTLLIIRP